MKYLFLFLLFFSPVNLFCQEIFGRVVGVSDGDTITVLDENKVQYKIRLYGIDAPEKKQPFGQKAKQHLSEMLFGKEVKVYVVNKDRYGRLVAHVDHDDFIGNANIYMLQDGYAWAYTKYIKGKVNKIIYLEYEKIAKNEKRGLWAEPNPIAPWEYRKLKKK